MMAEESPKKLEAVRKPAHPVKTPVRAFVILALLVVAVFGMVYSVHMLMTQGK